MKACPYCAEQIQDAAIKCRYCGSDLEVPAAARESHEPLQAASTRQRNIVTAGAVLVFFAPLLPWVHIVLLGSENLFNAGGIAPLIGLAQMAAAGWVAVLAWRQSRRRRLLGIVVGVIVVLVDGLLLIGLLHGVHDSYGFAQVGIGPWAGVAGALTMAIASLRMPKDESRSAAGAVVPPPAARPAYEGRLPFPPHPIEPDLPSDAGDAPS